MIKSFKHKDLKELFLTGKSSKVGLILQPRIVRKLDALNKAETLQDLSIPSFNFHGLHGQPKRFSIHVSGAWCLTFEWHEPNVYLLDLEQYH